MGLHLSNNVLYNMKSFIAFMAFLALANGQFTCDECKQGVTQLGQYLLTDAELAAVEEALSDLVCPTLPEENIEGSSPEFMLGGLKWLKHSLPILTPSPTCVLVLDIAKKCNQDTSSARKFPALTV